MKYMQRNISELDDKSVADQCNEIREELNGDCRLVSVMLKTSHPSLPSTFITIWEVNLFATEEDTERARDLVDAKESVQEHDDMVRQQQGSPTGRTPTTEPQIQRFPTRPKKEKR